MPDSNAIDGKIGLYVHPGDHPKPLPEQATTARSQPVGKIDRTWRGTTMGTVTLETIEGWTPDLNPPPGSPLFRWPSLT